MRPDRLVVGEVRGPEALDMLQALNTGHDGSVSTVHANGPVDTLTRLETLALLADVALPLGAVRAQIASAIDGIVFVARRRGTRHVAAIAEVVVAPDRDGPRVRQLFVAGADARLRGVAAPSRPSRRPDVGPVDERWVR
jgi:pilus assembly protein CpaF